MKDKIKTILALIGIILLFLFIIFITIVKYYVRPEKTVTTFKKEEVKNEEPNQEIRKISDVQNISQNKFSLKNIKITYNDDHLQITGTLKNNTNSERTFTINSTIYNEQKEQLETKDITLDTKIQPKDEIPIFINHYYDEFENDYSNIKYYRINITK